MLPRCLLQVLAVDGGLTTLHPHHPSEYAVYHSR